MNDWDDQTHEATKPGPGPLEQAHAAARVSWRDGARGAVDRTRGAGGALHPKNLGRQVKELEPQIQAWHRANDLSSKLAQVPVFGPILASALVASIGDAKNFESGRQLAAWLGTQAALLGWQVEPVGEKQTRRYLPESFTYTRRAYRSGQKADACRWVNEVAQRRNKNVVAVALSNKNSRVIWALLSRERRYETGYNLSAMKDANRPRTALS